MLAISYIVIGEIDAQLTDLWTLGFKLNCTSLQPHSACACINVPASPALAHLHFHGDLVECDANKVFVRSCSSGRAANVCTPLHCHPRPIWTPGSKFSPTYLKIRIKEKLCWKKRPLHSSHKPPCPFVSARFLLVAHVEGKHKCDAQCSFTGFLISVPHEGVFMLTTSDSTSWHYCTPHQGILSEGSTKAHSNWTMRPT